MADDEQRSDTPHIPQGLNDVRIGRRYTPEGVPLVKLDSHDENGVPYVRLTRTVQSGFGIGIGIALVQIIVGIIAIILISLFVQTPF